MYVIILIEHQSLLNRYLSKLEAFVHGVCKINQVDDLLQILF